MLQYTAFIIPEVYIYGEEKDIILYAINEEIDLTKSAAEQNLDYLIKNIEELIDIQTNSSTTKNQ